MVEASFCLRWPNSFSFVYGFHFFLEQRCNWGCSSSKIKAKISVVTSHPKESAYFTAVGWCRVLVNALGFNLQGSHASMTDSMTKKGNRCFDEFTFTEINGWLSVSIWTVLSGHIAVCHRYWWPRVYHLWIHWWNPY